MTYRIFLLFSWTYVWNNLSLKISTYAVLFLSCRKDFYKLGNRADGFDAEKEKKVQQINER